MSARPRVTRRRAALSLTITGGLLAAGGLAGLGPVGAQASSHREAPIISGLPQYDATDLYAFRSPERPNFVTLIANWLPFEEPGGGPNFYSFANDARYDVRIDNDGDARADVIFRWTFEDHYRSRDTFLYANGPVTSLGDENLNFYQTYRLVRIRDGNSTVLVNNRRVVPSNVGEASMPNYQALRNQGVTDIAGDGKSFAGQAEDPFFLDLRVFDLLYGGDGSESGDDTLAGFNVQSVALQVPRAVVAEDRDATANPIVGVWTTTERRTVGGDWRQVSRLGMPLVNEVVIPLRDKDRFNASDPRDDAQFLSYVTEPELPQLIEAVLGDDGAPDAPAEPRDDLVSVFLTGVDGLNQPTGVRPSEQLRLNMSTPLTGSPNRLGVIGGDAQGFPNGRRLTDDVIDIALQVVQGELVGQPNSLGDGVNQNDVSFESAFPYLALPESGSNADPHPSPTTVTARGGGADEGAGWLTGRALPGSLLGVGLLAMLVGLVGLTRRPTRRNVSA